MEMNTSLLDVLRGFRLDAEPVSCEPYGSGHINVTNLHVAALGYGDPAKEALEPPLRVQLRRRA